MDSEGKTNTKKQKTKLRTNIIIHMFQNRKMKRKLVANTRQKLKTKLKAMRTDDNTFVSKQKNETEIGNEDETKQKKI